ncbi:MAG: hypothetical protein BIFFINMI_00092 [Phycisphaerae bacterium]|nr:hypothetical protein [Phycisphaerae bacterium]
MNPDATIVLLAAGDLSFAGGVADGIAEHGVAWAFEGIVPALQGADIATANFESPVLPSASEPPPKGLVVPERLLAGLADALPSLAVTLANNHAYDAGVEGVLRTRSRLDEMDVAHFGSGRTEAEARAPRFVEVGGLRIGFLGRSEDCPQLHARGFPGPALMRMPDMLDDVRSAADVCDALVVHLHHGVEFVDWPGPHFVALCRAMIEAGATLVIGGHPHVPQGHEVWRHGHVFYCLGNLLFTPGRYMREGSAWTVRSALARIRVGRRFAGPPEWFPYRIDDAGRPFLLNGAEADAVRGHLADISTELADPDALRQRFRETALRYLGIYLGWAQDVLKAGGPQAVAEKFLPRLGQDESRQWVRELFAAADWPAQVLRPPWT